VSWFAVAPPGIQMFLRGLFYNAAFAHTTTRGLVLAILGQVTVLSLIRVTGILRGIGTTWGPRGKREKRLFICQHCHGAPGMVTTFADAPFATPEFDTLLLDDDPLALGQRARGVVAFTHPRAGGAHDRHHRTAGIAGRTWRCGRVAGSGARSSRRCRSSDLSVPRLPTIRRTGWSRGVDCCPRHELATEVGLRNSVHATQGVVAS
jgi:hypothetical protein